MSKRDDGGRPMTAAEKRLIEAVVVSYGWLLKNRSIQEFSEKDHKAYRGAGKRAEAAARAVVRERGKKR